MRRPVRLLTVAATAAALTLAGCSSGSTKAGGTGQSDPHAELVAAFSSLDNSSTLSLRLRLDTDAATLQALAKEGGDTLSTQDAQAIAGAQLLIEAQTTDGSKLSTQGTSGGSHTKARFVVSDNGRTLAEIRSVAKTLYAAADIRTILRLFGKEQAYGELTARANSLPRFVRAFVSGKWVSLDLGALNSALQQFGVGSAPTSSPQQGQKLVTDLRAVLAKDVTVRRAGSDSRGDHLVLNGQARRLVADFLDTIRSDIPAAEAGARSLNADQVHGSVTVDAYVKNGTLTQLSLDLAQFAPPAERKPGDHLPVVVDVSRSGSPISAPSGATPVDFSQLMTMLGALGGH